MGYVKKKLTSVSHKPWGTRCHAGQ